MAAPVLTAAAAIVCPHGGAVSAIGVAPRVLVGGAPVLTLSPATVRNCGLPPGEVCVSVLWQSGASRVLAGGNPVLIQSATGTCLSATGRPNGAPITAMTQARVLAV